MLTLHEARVSKIDGAEKLIFRTKDDHLIETVILKPESGRTASVFLLRWVCAVIAVLCNGLDGVFRNLSVASWISAVGESADQAGGRSVRNVCLWVWGSRC